MQKLSCSCAVLLLIASTCAWAQAKPLAETPPMGWNSWDSYGFTIDEADFRANVEVLAGLKQYGWQYAVIDEGWYMQNPLGKDTAEQKFLFDSNGLLLPDPKRYPSSAGNQGLKPLSDWVHAQGLKFGIHILRGIPKEVVEKNLPVYHSSFHASDAADQQATCPWSDANYGVADNAAGQAFYDSMIQRFADWGIDFIKVDCISDHPYRVTEIRQIAEAIRKTGRPIVLSLSPGPTQLSHAEEVAQYAQMWRITNDHWDEWVFSHHTDDGYPFGLSNEFDVIAAWNKYARPGAWPDPDMLPEGYIGPRPGVGPARQSHLSADEQKTEFTLWCMSRSPLIYGGNLTRLDDLGHSLMTNKELLDIDQHAVESNPITQLPAGFENVRVWFASTRAADTSNPYVAFFNLNDKPATLHFRWREIRPGFAGKHVANNVFTGEKTAPSEEMDVQLSAHGTALYRVQ